VIFAKLRIRSEVDGLKRSIWTEVTISMAISWLSNTTLPAFDYLFLR